MKKRKNENEKIKRVWEISQGLLITKKPKKIAAKKKLEIVLPETKPKRKTKVKVEIKTEMKPPKPPKKEKLKHQNKKEKMKFILMK